MSEGKLLVISGPSGVGKTEVALKLREFSDIYVKAVTATTRKIRVTETNGVDYYFVTDEEFIRMEKNGELLEHTIYNGNRYGTPKFSVEKSLSEGKVVILVIDVVGALNIKKMFSDAIMCFLNAESLAAIEKRLRNRGTDTEEAILGRLSVAKTELESIGLFDYTVMNKHGKMDEAVRDIDSIIRSLI